MQPTITIITATYNAAAELEWTIQSIRQQTYGKIQWIIADGGSTDMTVEVIKNNLDVIDVWFSEPDVGIYDAWNKAIPHVQGEWVQFIGAGDELECATTLSKVAEYLKDAHPNHDIAYGIVTYISARGRVPLYKSGEPWHQLKNKWQGYIPRMPVHPGVFHHRSVFSTDPAFDISYGMCADNVFLLRQRSRKPFLFMPLRIDRMPIGGLSGQVRSFETMINENRRAARELELVAPLSHRLYEDIKLIVKKSILRWLPARYHGAMFDFFRGRVGLPKKWTVR